MTYFTRFPINVTRRLARSMLASPYSLHAAIEGSFSNSVGEPTDDGRILWRIDRQPNGSTLLYIVSPEKPSLVGLDEQIGFPDLEEPQWVTRLYDPFIEGLTQGQRYSFRLVANPVINRRSIVNERGRSKRIPHLTALQQASWLVGAETQKGIDAEELGLLNSQGESRALRNGFNVCSNEPDGSHSLIVSNMRRVSFKRNVGGKPVTLATVQYDGILEVTDAVKLGYALTHGIGHAKSFGCGLLTLAPCGDR